MTKTTNFKWDAENLHLIPIGMPDKSTVIGFRCVDSLTEEGRVHVVFTVCETPEDMRDEIETGVHLTPEQLERMLTQPTVGFLFKDVAAIDRFISVAQRIRGLYDTPEEQWGSLIDPATHVNARIPIPEDFYNYRVLDKDGKEITNVVCADSEFGYFIREVVDPVTGIPVVEDGEIQTERIEDVEFTLVKVEKGG